MSNLSVSQFISRMKTDNIFAERIANADSKEERHSLIRSAGFLFNQEEFNMVFDPNNDEALVSSMSGNVLRSHECVCCKL